MSKDTNVKFSCDAIQKTETKERLKNDLKMTGYPQRSAFGQRQDRTRSELCQLKMVTDQKNSDEN